MPLVEVKENKKYLFEFALTLPPDLLAWSSISTPCTPWIMTPWTTSSFTGIVYRVFHESIYLLHIHIPHEENFHPSINMPCLQ